MGNYYGLCCKINARKERKKTVGEAMALLLIFRNWATLCKKEIKRTKTGNDYSLTVGEAGRKIR